MNEDLSIPKKVQNFFKKKRKPKFRFFLKPFKILTTSKYINMCTTLFSIDLFFTKKKRASIRKFDSGFRNYTYVDTFNTSGLNLKKINRFNEIIKYTICEKNSTEKDIFMNEVFFKYFLKVVFSFTTNVFLLECDNFHNDKLIISDFLKKYVDVTSMIIASRNDTLDNTDQPLPNINNNTI
jgi:hypothetical protein